MKLAGFFQCECGKLHAYGGVNRSSKCACGINLYWWSVFGEKVK